VALAKEEYLLAVEIGDRQLFLRGERMRLRQTN
jgi:hypothetical protein